MITVVCFLEICGEGFICRQKTGKKNKNKKQLLPSYYRYVVEDTADSKGHWNWMSVNEGSQPRDPIRSATDHEKGKDGVKNKS